MTTDASEFLKKLYGDDVEEPAYIKKPSPFEQDREELSVLFAAHAITANQFLSALLNKYPERHPLDIINHVEWAMGRRMFPVGHPHNDWSFYFSRNMRELHVSLSGTNRASAQGRRRAA